MNNTLILASASPRRKDILIQCGFSLILDPRHFDESLCQENSPQKRVSALSNLKMNHYLQSSSKPAYPVLTGDTLLGFEGQVLEKPRDRMDAKRMLELLSQRTHTVYSSLCVYSPEKEKLLTHTDQTEVRFRRLSPELIDWYLDSQEWTDAAGAYKMQEKGGILVEKISGHPSTVVGLSIPSIYVIFTQLNLAIG